VSSGGRPARNQLAGVIRGARWRPSGGRPERHQLPLCTWASGGRPSSCSLWGGHSKGLGGRRVSSGGRPASWRSSGSGGRRVGSGGGPARDPLAGVTRRARWRLSGGRPERPRLPLRSQDSGGRPSVCSLEGAPSASSVSSTGGAASLGCCWGLSSLSSTALSLSLTRACGSGSGLLVSWTSEGCSPGGFGDHLSPASPNGLLMPRWASEVRPGRRALPGSTVPEWGISIFSFPPKISTGVPALTSGYIGNRRVTNNRK
jgi:hypothetical protein